MQTGVARLFKEISEITHENFWQNPQYSKINAMRTQTLLKKCDIAIVCLGEKYKQCHVDFDAGYYAALGKPHISVLR